MKTWNKWSEEEREKLKIHWKSSTMKELLEQFPNRTYQSLMKEASKLGIKSEVARKRKGSLEFLNQLNPKSCYWWGFIIADGHLAKRGDLIIQLDIQDENHLKKLNEYLNTTIYYKESLNTYTKNLSKQVILRIADKSFANKWLNILSINAPKTYFPPDLSIFYTKEYLLPFVIGLIDGDGCIWEGNDWLNLRIELHGNWLNTLQLISDKLKKFYDIDCKIKTSKRGFSQLNINTKKDLKILKDYIPNVNYLERKWNKLSNL
jgi:hypothetical protein